MGFVFVLRSFGYLIGSVLGGPLFDHLNGNHVISFGLLLCAAGSLVIPFITKLWLLALVISTTGLAMGFLDTGGNVSMVWLHGDDVGPYMQSLHFFFGVGAFASPFIIGQVIKLTDGHVTWAFFTFAAVSVPIAVWLLFFPNPRHHQQEHKGGSADTRDKVFVVMTGLFLCVYVGAEVSAGGYLPSYAVLRGFEDEAGGAFLASGFWGTLTLGRMLAIPVAFYLSAQQSLVINLVGCIFSTTFWLMFIDNRTVLWLGTLFYGVFMSSTFPTAINLAESYVHLTGRLASVFVVGASFGEMVVPFMIANLIEKVGPISLLVVLLLCSVAGFGIYGLLILIGRKTRKNLGIAPLPQDGEGDFVVPLREGVVSEEKENDDEENDEEAM